MTFIHAGSIWRHTAKQLEYVVVGMAKCSRTLKPQVVYRQLYRSKDTNLPDYGLWTRDKKEFLGKVVVEGKVVSRFNYMGETSYDQYLHYCNKTYMNIL